ncbi:hypothetical protein [Pyruvatibacter sp.]
MATASQILLSLAWFHMSDKKIAKVLQEAEEALGALDQWDSEPDMARKGIFTIVETLNYRKECLAGSLYGGRPQSAASRCRYNLLGDRPKVEGSNGVGFMWAKAAPRPE